MSMKPKTGRRLLLVGVSAALLLAAAGGVFGVRRYQMQRITNEYRTQGFALFEQKEYFDALSKFAAYLKRLDETNDIPAMLAYAECREMVEEPDASHIRQAIDWYRKAWNLNASDTKTGLKLMDLYVAIGMNTEAKDTALRMRPSTISAAGQEHFDVLQREVAARSVLAPKDEINGQLLQRMLELRPTDFPTMVLFTEWSRQQQGRTSAMRFAEEKAKDQAAKLTPGQASLLMATARRDEPGYDWQAATFEALCDVTGLDPVSAGPVREVQYPSALDVLRSATLFDSLNAFGHSLSVMQAGQQQFKDPTIARSLARRLWMMGRGNDIAKLFGNPDLSPSGDHTEVLIYRVLALHDANQLDEAQRIADALAERKGDFRVVAWQPAFKALLTRPALSDAEKLDLFEKAVEKSRFDPVLRVFLGDTLEALGRYAEARRNWNDATRTSLSAGWMQPWLRKTYALLNEGRVKSAYESAGVAMRYSPRSMAAYIALFRTQVAMVRDGFDIGLTPAQLLSQVDRLDAELSLDQSTDAKLFREIVLPGRVLLTSRVRDKASATRLLADALAKNDSLSQDTLSGLLDVSTFEGLGKGEEILTRLDKVGGLTISAVFPRAVTLLNAGKKEEGLALLEKHAVDADPAKKVQWQRAIARYLDGAQDDRAKDRWAVISDGNPTDLSAALAALESSAVLKDKVLVDRLIKRSIELGKYDATALPSQLRLAQARSLLAEPVTASSRASAVDILQSLTKLEADWIEPRTLLVSAHAMDKPEAGIKPNLSEAIKELRALVSYAPDPAPLAVQLARLYRVSGDFASAKAELERVASSPSAAPQLRLEAADMLITQREMAAAETALEQLQIDHESMRTPDVDARLASVYRSLNSSGQLQQALRRLLAANLTNPDHAFITADGFASLKDLESAREALLKLDAMKLNPGEKQIVLSKYEARNGDAARAVALLEEACKLAPQNEGFWIALASLHVERNNIDLARDAAARGLKVANPKERLPLIASQIEAMGSGAAEKLDLVAIADELAKQPGLKDREAAVRRVERERVAGRLADINVVRELMANFDADPAMVQVLARTLLQGVSPGRPDLAADVLRSGLAKHPSEVEMASLATRVFRGVGAFSDMERSARQWRDLVRSPESELAVVEAMVLGKRYANAIEELQPLIKRAESNPGDPFGVRVYTMLGQSLCAMNKVPDALQEISPLLDRAPELITAFWLPAAAQLVSPEASARAWIVRVRPLLDMKNESQAIALANAYAGVGMRFPESRSAMLGEARNVLNTLVQANPPGSARVLESMGWVLQQQGNTADAQIAYRQTIEKDPRALFALRGLTQIAMQENITEAVAFARRAAEVGGANDVESKSLLGTALLQASSKAKQKGDVAGSIASASEAFTQFDAILTMQPSNALAMMQAIESLDAADRSKDTIPRYEELLKLPRASLPAGITMPMVLNNYAYTLLRTGAKGLDLDRAFSMAEQASQQMPSPATFDTLGYIEFARGNRKQAIAAFRTAIERDSKAFSSMVGLAEVLLSTPSSGDVEAAKKLLDDVDRAGAAVPRSLQDKVVVLRRKLP
jgi:tetratricopeptide (TPR) repeat protein